MKNDYPQYAVHWKTGHGFLTDDFEFKTPITGHTVKTLFIDLRKDGTLKLALGYVWDFGSGPAIDTPDMVYASLAHDPFYELMLRDLLPWSLRKKVDQYFKKLLKKAGMGWLRRQWVYGAVRYLYPISRRFGSRKAKEQAAREQQAIG